MKIEEIFNNSNNDDGIYEKTKSLWNTKFSSLFSKSKIDESFWEELEESLVTSDVNVSFTFELIEFLKSYSMSNNINDPQIIINLIKEKFIDLFRLPSSPIINSKKKIILFIGVNGSGKTTTIAKLSKYISNNGHSLLITAADTFRAAAKEQIQQWGDDHSFDVFSSSKSKDPSAVVYDAIASAKSKDLDFLLVDTAGRLHTSHNLMEEMNKIYRTILKFSEDYEIYPLLIMDGTVGQNGINQAKEFNSLIPCNGIIMTKMDGTSKGGALISIAHELHIPIIFVGVGESIDSLIEFDPTFFVDNLLPQT